MLDRSLKDQTTFFLLGELDPQTRAEFEVKQDQNAELRAYVQEAGGALEQVMASLPPGEPRAAPAVRSNFLAVMAAGAGQPGFVMAPPTSRPAALRPEPASVADRLGRPNVALLLNATLALGLAAWLSFELWRSRDATISENAALRTQLDVAGARTSHLRSGQDEAARTISALKERDAQLERENAALKQEVAQAREEARTLTERTTREIQALRDGTDLAQLRVSVLRSAVPGDDEATAPMRAIVVWDATKQVGAVTFENLPSIPSSQDYQVWAMDPSSADAISLGVIHPTKPAAQSSSLRPAQRVVRVGEFHISLERKGGAPRSEGPTVLVSDR